MLVPGAPSCTTLAIRHASPRPSRYAACARLSHDRRVAGAARFDGLSTSWTRGQILFAISWPVTPEIRRLSRCSTSIVKQTRETGCFYSTFTEGLCLHTTAGLLAYAQPRTPSWQTSKAHDVYGVATGSWFYPLFHFRARPRVPRSSGPRRGPGSRVRPARRGAPVCIDKVLYGRAPLLNL